MKKVICKLQQNVRKVGVVALPVALTVVTALPVYAEDGTGSTSVDITSTLITAFTTVQHDMLGTINGALPIALVVVGAVMCVRFGIKFFRQVAK